RVGRVHLRDRVGVVEVGADVVRLHVRHVHVGVAHVADEVDAEAVDDARRVQHRAPARPRRRVGGPVAVGARRRGHDGLGAVRDAAVPEDAAVRDEDGEVGALVQHAQQAQQAAGGRGRVVLGRLLVVLLHEGVHDVPQVDGDGREDPGRRGDGLRADQTMAMCVL
ncbi:hypothetical protein EG864_14860, partial [Enterococcus faecalis]